MSLQELDALRAKIDTIDEEIVRLLSDRFDITDLIGRIKATENLNSSSPDREAIQFQRLEDLAADKNLPPSLVERIFRTIIDEVVRKHDQTRTDSDHPDRRDS